MWQAKNFPKRVLIRRGRKHIYIVTHRNTVSLYHNFSVWLEPWYIYIYIYIYIYWLIVGSVRLWSRRLGFNSRTSHTRIKKTVLDSSLPDAQYYQVEIKVSGTIQGRVLRPQLHLSFVVIKNRTFGSPSIKCKIQLGWQYGTKLKSHGAVTNWSTGRWWPVNCMTVISARWWSNIPFQSRWKLYIPLGSCIFRWEEIAWVWKRVYISAWEFDGNIRSTNRTEDSLFTQACPVVCGFLGHRLLTPKSPGLIDERFLYLSWLLLLHTIVRRENKCIFLYICIRTQL